MSFMSIKAARNTQKQKLTFLALLALVMGNMVGSGIYLLPASLAGIGSISLYSWIFSSLGALLLAFIFANLSKKIKNTGGPYIYTKKILGNFSGFQTAYSYWIAILITEAALAIAFTSYFSVFWPYPMNSISSSAIAITVVWLSTTLNILSVSNIGRIQIIFTIFKFVPLILIAIFGWQYIHKDFYSQYYNVSGKSDFTAFSAAIAITFWSFCGIESATVPSGLVKRPQITVPIATILGVIMVTIIYICCSAVAMGMINPEILRYSTSPMADAAQIMIGDIGRYLIACSAALACLGSLHGWTLLQGQVSLAVAEDKMLPEIFAEKNKQGIPAKSLMITALIVTLLIIATSYTPLSTQFLNLLLLGTLANIIPYIYTSIAFIKFHRNTAKEKNKIFYLIAALMTVIYLLWALLAIDKKILLAYGIVFLTGSILYKNLSITNKIFDKTHFKFI